MQPVALTIAGSDPSGGAGLQADLKTFHQHGVYGMSVVTLLTVQNTQSVRQVHVQRPQLIADQLNGLLTDIPPQAAKTGALGGPDAVAVVAEHAKAFDFPLVVDPVMISKHGARLIDQRAIRALLEQLLPQAFLVTPNLHEAAVLAEIDVHDEATMADAARTIAARGAQHVLVKGGHLTGEAVDLLWSDDRLHRLVGPRLNTPHTHGTGCVYSAAITARLARGDALIEAVTAAKGFLTTAIRTNPGLGHGQGPVNLFAKADPEP
jgi:hydroxymethylpyrimidine/phosphomethylpyrimidine kinase